MSPSKLVALLGTLAACGEPPAPPPPPPVAVTTTTVVQRLVPEYVEYIGQTAAANDVEIRARAEGFVDEIAFTEGRYVTAGDVLVRIDPRELEQALERAKGSRGEAEARLAKAHQDSERLRPLAEMEAIPKQDHDTAVQAERLAEAGVDSAEAVVRRAELDLDYATVRAPVDGLIGDREVSVGDFVGRGEASLLTTISVIDEMHVYFTVSEVEYLEYSREHGDPALLAADATERGKPPEIELLLADGSSYPHRGRWDFADRTIDTATGTLKLRAVYPNPERLLRPGQFVRVRIKARENDALLVPQRSVKDVQGTTLVVVVAGDGTASFRNVRMGPRFEQLWVVEEGLAAGDEVVVEGLQKILKSGVQVQATRSDAP